MDSRRPTSNWRNFVTFGKDNLKCWGSTTSCLVNEKNHIFSMSISWDTFAVSKDEMLFLYSFPHHMAVSGWVLLEILTNIGIIHLVPLSLLTWKANSGPGAGLSLVWSVDLSSSPWGFLALGRGCLCSHAFEEEAFCSFQVSKSLCYFLPFLPQAAGDNLKPWPSFPFLSAPSCVVAKCTSASRFAFAIIYASSAFL